MRKTSDTAPSYQGSSQKKLIISAKKQRKISFSHLSLTGSISSLKNNDSIQFESSLERDFIYLLEFDKEVFRYVEQPFKLYYYKNDMSMYYVPDFYVEYWNGRKELVEIKYQDDLIKNKSKYREKFKIAEVFCKENNIEFKIYSEIEIRTHRLFNADFLLSYKKPKYGFNSNDTLIVTKVLRTYDLLTVQQVLDLAVKSEDKKAELLYVIWYMVSNYLIYFDNESKLNMETKLWLPK